MTLFAGVGLGLCSFCFLGGGFVLRISITTAVIAAFLVWRSLLRGRQPDAEDDARDSLQDDAALAEG